MTKKYIHLGAFSKIEEAAESYNKALILGKGDLRKLNEIKK